MRRALIRGASLTELVAAAREGNEEAWVELVGRFEGLVWAVANRFRQLPPVVREEVAQNTWEKLVDWIDRIDPERLPGWIKEVTTNEGIRWTQDRLVPSESMADRPETEAVSPDSRLLLDEMRIAVAEAFAEISPRCQDLLRHLVVSDPPLPYREVQALLEMKHGSIGPNQRRCLEALRQRRVLAPFVGEDR